MQRHVLSEAYCTDFKVFYPGIAAYNLIFYQPSLLFKKKKSLGRTSLGGPVAKTPEFPIQETQVQSLVRELDLYRQQLRPTAAK